MLVLLVALRLRDVKNLKGTLSDKYVAFFNYPAFILLGFIGIVVGIYFVTYIPDVLAGDSLGNNLQFTKRNVWFSLWVDFP